VAQGEGPECKLLSCKTKKQKTKQKYLNEAKIHYNSGWVLEIEGIKWWLRARCDSSGRTTAKMLIEQNFSDEDMEV
jgi:hypothetical protein